MTSDILFSGQSNSRGPWAEAHRIPLADGVLVFEANETGEIRVWFDTGQLKQEAPKEKDDSDS